MAPIDRSHTTLCWSSIVTIAPLCTIFEYYYLTLSNIMILKSRLLEVAPFNRSHSRRPTSSYSSAIVIITMPISYSYTIFEMKRFRPKPTEKR